MAPRPEDDGFETNTTGNTCDALPFPQEGEEVVISGISGSFPDSDGVQMFGDKLLNKVDLVSADDRRWNLDHPEIPQRTGKLYNLEKFDAAFFGVHRKQADVMDPMLRVALERVFEAIADAGVNPFSLRGTKTGVFTGTSFSESEKTWFYDNIEMDGLGVTNCSRGTMANRISYWLGLVGPSFVVDTACSSSLYALERAYFALRTGQCDSAIVLGASLCLHPFVSLQFARLGVLAPDGRCKSFDGAANGYTRSEAIPAVFVQKSKDAKRIYARVVHARTNCDGFKEMGITYPSGKMQLELLKEFYQECCVDPTTISFVEAHGTGTKVGDPEECNSLDKVFCQGRTSPLLIGSVKSNMGHSEPASGLCSVAKAIVALERETIPPNLNFKDAKSEIVGLIEGRLQVVTEPTPLPGDKGLIGINSFGFGGANAHVLLEWNKKKKIKGGLPSDKIPRLVVASGRTQEAVHVIFDDIKSRPLDGEFVQLLNELFSEGITGHIHRGFAIYSTEKELTRSSQELVDLSNEKISFVFPGIESQSKALAKSLFNLPAFAASIEIQQAALESENINLKSILTADNIDFSNIVNAVLILVATQIGIVDCLASVGLYPAAALAFSFGEFACAYAVRKLTVQQAIQAAYHVASVLKRNSKSRMATLKIGLDEVKTRALLSDSVKISSIDMTGTSIVGPASIVEKMKTMLTSLRIPVEDVGYCGVGLHSSHIANLENEILEGLKKIIPYPQRKNESWIHNNVETFREVENLRNTCSPQYFTQVLINPLNYPAVISILPSQSIVLELASRSTFSKEVQEKSLLHLNLLDQDALDSTVHILTAIGQLYLHGVNINLSTLYPSVKYPVSRGTPMIGSLIKWDHSRDWFVPKFGGTKTSGGGETKVVISLNSEDSAYFYGHMIDGRVLYPATGYVNLVADIMSNLAGDMSKEKLLVFEDVQFLRATPLNVNGAFHEFTVSVQKTTGRFEIMEGGAIVSTGLVHVYSDNFEAHKADPKVLKHDDASIKDNVVMLKKDIYKELRLRGYNYTGAFRGLESVEYSGRRGQVQYNPNLVGFMDTMLQIQILNIKSRDLYVPVSIGKIIIDSKAMFYALQKTDPDNPVFPINYYKDVNIITAGGVEIWNLRAQQIPRRKPLGEPVLEKFLFRPNNLAKNVKEEGDVKNMVEFMIHLALENLPGIKVKALEIADNSLPIGSELLAPHIANVLSNLPLIQADVRVVAENDSLHITENLQVAVDARALATEKDCSVITGSLLLQRQNVLQKVLASIKPTAFIISRENPQSQLTLDDLQILADYVIGDERFVLLRKRKECTGKTLVIPITNDFSWIEPLKDALKSEAQTVIALVEKEQTSGVIGLVNCLTKEPSGEKIRCVYIRDDSAPPFKLDLPFYAEQLKKDLIMNVYENGCWGSYRHQSIGDITTVPAQHIYINNAVRGDLSSVTMFQGPQNRLMQTGEIKNRKYVKVHYASINFKDVLIVSGRVVLPGSNELNIGIEFSGINEKGEHVMGVLSRGAMTSLLIDPDPLMTWKVPKGISLEEAATIPIVYVTVYHAVVVCGRPRRGESILIHSAAGGIGIAAINVALGLGLNIFVTVGTPEKKQYLLQQYPQIPEQNIGNSRDTSFEDMIRKETNHRGVDMVLNSLSDEKMEASLRCLAPRGRFLEIGKYDLLNNTAIDLSPFAKNISYHSCMLDVALEGNEELRELLKNEMIQVLESGFVKPLPTTVFEIETPEPAFRYMTTGKHIGKVLMRVQDENQSNEVPKLFNAVPRYFANTEASYIVIGGLGGFGLELSNWLVARGARSLVLTSRNGIRNGYQESRVRLWQENNVNVHISTDDISTEAGVTKLLNDANKLAPVAGIFNLAVVLEDSVFENQSEESFKASFCGKALATAHLDKLSRQLCPRLEDFVVFSSVSCGRGNAGQTNYGMSNSVMERICENRKRDGLPALAVQWGAVGEVGLVAEMAEVHQDLVIGGTLQQTIGSCLQCMDVFLNQPAPVVASMVVAEKRSLRGAGSSMVDSVCVILGIRDLKTVSHKTSLSELGMDSMMAVEIKQTLEREFELFLTAQDLRSMTFAKLSELDAAASAGSAVTAPPVPDLGLNIILQKIPTEEEAFNDIVKLETASSDGVPVFFIPGLDGITSVFTNIAAQLKTTAYALTYPHKRNDNTSIKKTAEIMLPVMLHHLNSKNEFKLIGYSAGSLVAIELALLLEANGYYGKVILIDGTPALCLAILRRLGIGDSDEEITNAVLLSLQGSLIGDDAEKSKYSELQSLDDKISHLEDKVLNKSSHRREYLKESTQDLILRLKNVKSYTINEIIKSPVVLIKPAEVTCSEITGDFELSTITSEAPDVITVKGNHISMLATSEIAEIVFQKLQ